MPYAAFAADLKRGGKPAHNIALLGIEYAQAKNVGTFITYC